MVVKPAMSFEQIGSRLGITPGEAYDDYRRGLSKLRKKPRARRFLEMAKLLERLRNERVNDALDQLSHS